jgi:hypothetical protein
MNDYRMLTFITLSDIAEGKWEETWLLKAVVVSSRACPNTASQQNTSCFDIQRVIRNECREDRRVLREEEQKKWLPTFEKQNVPTGWSEMACLGHGDDPSAKGAFASVDDSTSAQELERPGLPTRQMKIYILLLGPLRQSSSKS